MSRKMRATGVLILIGLVIGVYYGFFVYGSLGSDLAYVWKHRGEVTSEYSRRELRAFNQFFLLLLSLIVMVFIFIFLLRDKIMERQKRSEAALRQSIEQQLGILEQERT